MPLTRLAPGLHTGIPADRYHADDLCSVPTLSSSIAGLLINATPKHAWSAHPRLNPEPWEEKARKTLDIGSVAHELILGIGAGYVEVEADNWTTKAAKAERDAALADGKTPILTKDLARAEDIAGSVTYALSMSGSECLDFFDKGARSEVVGLWQDIGGPMCRMMIDRLTPGGVVYDIKTTARGIGNRAIQNKLEDGLALQAGFYLRGLAKLNPDLAGRFKWRWVFVEQDEPHEVRIIEADGETLALGDRLAALAIEKWRLCLQADDWPGYPRRIERIGLNDWAHARAMEREETDPAAATMVLSSSYRPPPKPKTLVYGDTFELLMEADQ